MPGFRLQQTPLLRRDEDLQSLGEHVQSIRMVPRPALRARVIASAYRCVAADYWTISLERLVAGVSPGRAAAVTWEALTAQPGLAEPCTRRLALGLEREALARALGGSGVYPRRGRVCGRLVRILGELGLAEYTLAGQGGRLARRAVVAVGADLERSAASRACAARLAAVERYLATAAPVARGQVARGRRLIWLSLVCGLPVKEQQRRTTGRPGDMRNGVDRRFVASQAASIE